MEENSVLQLCPQANLESKKLQESKVMTAPGCSFRRRWLEGRRSSWWHSTGSVSTPSHRRSSWHYHCSHQTQSLEQRRCSVPSRRWLCTSGWSSLPHWPPTSSWAEEWTQSQQMSHTSKKKCLDLKWVPGSQGTQVNYAIMHIRPAENIFGQNAQTPQWTLGQNVSAYQFWALYHQFLPRRQSFKVGHFSLS